MLFKHLLWRRKFLGLIVIVVIKLLDQIVLLKVHIKNVKEYHPIQSPKCTEFFHELIHFLKSLIATFIALIPK